MYSIKTIAPEDVNYKSKFTPVDALNLLVTKPRSIEAWETAFEYGFLDMDNINNVLSQLVREATENDR